MKRLDKTKWSVLGRDRDETSVRLETLETETTYLHFQALRI